MTDEISAFITVRWRKLRLHAIATLFDIGFYLVLWFGVICIHLVRLGAVAIGIGPEVTKPVHWAEVGTNLYLFGSFFWRIIVRATRDFSA
jgi:hypothetical protein